MHKNRLLFITFIIVLSLLGIFLLFLGKSSKKVTDFSSCAKAGYPILESYPARCATPDGKTFVEKLSPEEEEKLRPPDFGCKNLCGDGICAEIVCMGTGCPCAESSTTCPADCK